MSFIGKILSFTFNHAAQADLPTPTFASSAAFKTALDSQAAQLQTSVNNLIDALNSVTPTSSGSENLGSAPISGVGGATAYAQLVDLKAQLNAAVIGTIPDGTLDYTKLNTATKSILTEYGLARQAIIGNFDVWQRGTSFAVGAGALYTADGWQAYRGSLVVGMTVTQQDGGGNYGSKYCLRAQRDSGNANGNTLNVAQPMESIDSQKLRGKKVTLSFNARAGVNYSAAGSLLNVLLATGTGTDQSVTGVITGYANVINSNVVLTTAWQKFILTVPAVLADAVNQLFTIFNSTPVGTAGANDYFEIGQVLLNAGDQALPFQPRSYADELALCQRTCIVLTDELNSQAVIGYGFAAATTVALIDISLPRQMRIQPTLTANAADFTLTDGTTTTALTAISIQPSQNGRSTLTIRATVAAGLTQFRPYSLNASAINKLLIFDAAI